MGDNASKNKLFSQLVSIGAVLKGYAKFVIYRWLRIFDDFTSDISYFRPYAERKNNGCDRKSA